MTPRSLVYALAAVALATTAAAQPPEPLFVHRGNGAVAAAEQVGVGRQAVASRSRVGLRIDRLFGAAGVAARILLNAGEHVWVARFERFDLDAAGFRSWVGAIEEIAESHVVITERDGIVSGLVTAGGTTYQIRTEVPGSYLLERVDIGRLGDEREPLADASGDPHPADHAAFAADDGGTIDVLMLYTPSARARRGGTAQIEALVSQILSDTNTALARSGVAARMRLAGVQELALAESSQMSNDLSALRFSSAAPSLRNTFRADLVQLLVNSPDLSSCGAGYLLTSLSSTDFPAYSVADVACAAQYTPTHEMGHNMGSHHAPEDGASGALFAYSYGFKDAARSFRTVMAYTCPGGGCARIPNFSNPAVSHNGGPTGTTAQHNARSLSEAAFTVANFRQAPLAATPPAAPTNLRSSVQGNTVTVAWDPVTTSDAAPTAYVLQVGTVPGATNLFNASIGSTTSASGVVGNGTYHWRVIATNTAGSSPPSTEAQFTVGVPCTAPSAPRDFTFSVSGRTVLLMWTPPAGGTPPIGYVLEAGSAAGLANLLATGVGSGTSLTTAAPPGTYYVRVRAQNACGLSAASNEQVIPVP